MGERKGLSKYYPPYFDPSKLSRLKKPKDREVSSHFMLPMSIRCLTCGEFMGAGLKFNAKKTTAKETYLGTKIYRFSMKCKACPATFIIKTDPEHADYVCEAGAKRNFEPWRASKEAEDEEHAVREEQDQDAIQALENKTLDAKDEMDELDALDELKATKARAARITTEDLFERHRVLHGSQILADGMLTDQQLEREARNAFAAKRHEIRRLKDESDGTSGERASHDILGNAQLLPAQDEGKSSQSLHVDNLPVPSKRPLGFSGFVVVKKPKRLDASKSAEVSDQPTSKATSSEPQPALKPAGLPGIVAYASGSDGSTSSSSADA